MKHIGRSAPLLATIGAICMIIVGSASCQLSNSSTSSREKMAIDITKSTLVPSIEIEGNLSLPNQRKLSFDTSGTIKEINVKRGDKVSKGQLLVRFDDTEQRLAIDSAQHDVSKAKNAMEKRVCPVPGKSVYDYINAPGVLDTLESMQVELEKAAASIATKEYDEASKELLLAKDDLGRAKRVLLDSYIRIYSHGLELSTLIQYSLDLEKAKIALEKVKEELKKTVIIAPFDGIIAEVYLKEGDKLSATNYSTTPVLHLIDPTLIEMEALVTEIDTPKVKQGQEAIITIDALPDLELKGKVTFISPAATIKGGIVYYKVILSLQTDHPELKDGMSARARIDVERKNSITPVPE